MNRRLLLLASACLLAPLASPAALDREGIVRRHTVRVTEVNPESPLSVGNGDFAFTVDATGLQTFETLYHEKGIPLETLSTWAWHSFPNPEGLTLNDAMVSYDFHGRSIPFAGKQNSPAGAYFRENPHPIPLGQISLLYQGRLVRPDEISAIDQTLNLWTGLVRSRYTLAGQPVTVETVADATQSIVGIRIISPLARRGELAVRVRFAYSYKPGGRNKPPLVWDQPDKHQTVIAHRSANSAVLARTLDASHYATTLNWLGAAKLEETAPHEFRLTPDATDTLSFTCAFTPSAPAGDTGSTYESIHASSIKGWADYWTQGGMIDLSASTDPRAAELERRVILSQYLMRVNYAGAFPPAEDGLTNITWFGKHNSEMYYWHAAQFYVWGRTHLLEKGLAWYQQILPLALADAKSQGFEGARWPKMAGIDGRPSPGSINPFIIWNQPNPIALCELVYRARPDRMTLQKYQDIVFESARFLASFAQLDPQTQRYVLGPPVKNVSEDSGENKTRNPTFELAYWYYGLKVAQTWRERLGLKPEPLWADILARLTPLPVKDGKYLEIETFPELYAREKNLPTSMLMALGFMPKVDVVDLETLRRTFHEVNRRNGVDHWSSWQVGQAALTAARLGEPETAVHIVTMKTPTNRFMNAGHVRRPKEPAGCPAYLPVNASVLLAVGLMAAGWDGAPDVAAPGFPQDGKWVVKAEGLNKMP
ncbi:hypothetical protein [Opitutus sp. ER46]|uniref:hypothetical protein n=1 Tax=Opitutus sp. ER46 TaxID=2161864 RepID=UPI000D300347|nr:hypothetical protein [Opitutus sp. ER46]PTX91051.1 hypothetical protein DB354_20645 [Opitutus sp. ER46]